MPWDERKASKSQPCLAMWVCGHHRGITWSWCECGWFVPLHTYTHSEILHRRVPRQREPGSNAQRGQEKTEPVGQHRVPLLETFVEIKDMAAWDMAVPGEATCLV